MKLKIYFILGTFFCFEFTAQSVISNAGEFWNNTSGSLSWTLGEVVTETLTSDDFYLTQGFQQIHEGYLNLSDLVGSNDLLIFPNPFYSEINILNIDFLSSLQIVVFDNLSKVVFNAKTSFSPAFEQSTIDLSFLVAGYYTIELYNPINNKRNKQRLIKLNND